MQIKSVSVFQLFRKSSTVTHSLYSPLFFFFHLFILFSLAHSISFNVIKRSNVWSLHIFISLKKYPCGCIYDWDIVDEFSTCPKIEWFMNNLIFEIPSLYRASAISLNNTHKQRLYFHICMHIQGTIIAVHYSLVTSVKW